MNEMQFFGQWRCVTQDKATAEHLQVALALAPRLPSFIISACQILPNNLMSSSDDFSQFMGTQDGMLGPYLSNQYLRKLAPILKSATHCHPSLHRVWAFVLREKFLEADEEIAASGDKSAGSSKTQASISITEKELQSFWKIVVEEQLLTSSLERKYCALKLCWRLIPLLPPNLLRPMLSRRFLRFLAQQQGSTTNNHHKKKQGKMEGKRDVLSAVLLLSSWYSRRPATLDFR